MRHPGISAIARAYLFESLEFVDRDHEHVELGLLRPSVIRLFGSAVISGALKLASSEAYRLDVGDENADVHRIACFS